MENYLAHQKLIQKMCSAAKLECCCMGFICPCILFRLHWSDFGRFLEQHRKNLNILYFLLCGALVLLRLHTREFHQNISHISCSFFHDKMCTGGKMLNIYHTTQRVVLVSSGHFCNCSRNPSVFACAWGHNILLTIVAHIYCECGVF